MASEIIPVSRSLFLCDFYTGYENGKIDLYGVWNAARPAIYPHVRPRLVVFAQLSGGVGDVPFFVSIRREHDDEQIRLTEVRTIRFPDRTSSIQLALTIAGVEFTEPGVYVVNLFCHNTWVCDTVLLLQ